MALIEANLFDGAVDLRFIFSSEANEPDINIKKYDEEYIGGAVEEIPVFDHQFSRHDYHNHKHLKLHSDNRTIKHII